MQDLIIWNMVSVDGYFEASDHEIDWFTFDDELSSYILDTQRSAGTLLFGRTTYELMASYWPSAEGEIADFMNSVPKVVFSHTLSQADWANTRVAQDPAAEVPRLKQQADGELFVFGSAKLTDTLLRHKLVDELRIGLNPLLLGVGTPLFRHGPGRMPLRLTEVRTLTSGLVILHYRPEEEPADG